MAHALDLWVVQDTSARRFLSRTKAVGATLRDLMVVMSFTLLPVNGLLTALIVWYRLVRNSTPRSARTSELLMARRWCTLMNPMMILSQITLLSCGSLRMEAKLGPISSVMKAT